MKLTKLLTKPGWGWLALGTVAFLVLKPKKVEGPKAPGSPEGTEVDEGVSGPLTIHIDHLDGADTVYEQAGPPSIWGRGLVHQDIEGLDDDPVFGEAKGPVAPPSSGGGLPIGWILGGLGALALGAAIVLPDKGHSGGQDARSNPKRRRRRKKKGASKRRRGTGRRAYRGPRGRRDSPWGRGGWSVDKQNAEIGVINGWMDGHGVWHPA